MASAAKARKRSLLIGAIRGTFPELAGVMGTYWAHKAAAAAVQAREPGSSLRQHARRGGERAYSPAAGAHPRGLLMVPLR